MKSLRLGLVLAAILLTSPAVPATVNLASPTGTVDLVSDGTNNVSVSALCGNGAAATILGACQYQAIVNSSGQFLTLDTQSGTWTVQPGNTANTTAWLVTGTGGTFPVTAASLPLPTGAATAALQVPADACTNNAKSGAPISLTASGQIITGTSAKKTYLCSIDITSATTQSAALVEGTGTTCATNIFGLAGGTTAATGWPLPANGGLTLGSGSGTVISPSADTNATAANVCLLLSSTGQVSGHITYVQQ